MSLGLAKIFSIFGSIGAGVSSFLGESTSLVDISDLGNSFAVLLIERILTLVGHLVFTLSKFCLCLIDFFQVVVYKFLGITVNIDDYVVYDKNNPLISFLTNDTVITVLRSAMIVGVVLVIIFTIFAIVMGEYNQAVHGQAHSVKMAWSRAFRALFGMVAFPITFMVIIILINALLAQFASILSANANISLGGQVFALSAYDANVYRRYANNNQRIPIYIDFYDPYNDGTYTRYTPEELNGVYAEFKDTGKIIYDNFYENGFASFADSVQYSYRNNSLINNKDTFSGYEKFIATAEQYQVMADFVDYAVAHGITYYYKPVSDEDIDWKFVQNSIYNEADGSLSITYKDASDLNPEADYYTVVYQTAPYIVSSPIQDALGTLSTLLSLDSNYHMMLDYMEGSINQVAWATDKVFLKLSENYKDPTKWTITDQILLYEYYRYEYNNSLKNFALTDLEDGVYVDAYTIDCQYFRDYTNSYVTLQSYEVVILNGNYYLIDEALDEDNEVICDSYGDPIYDIVGGESAYTALQDLTTYNNDPLNADKQDLGVYVQILDKWYSAQYNEGGIEIPNTLSEYMADTVGTEIVKQTVDEEGIVTEIIYGFLNPNGYPYAVDRIKATVNTKQVDWANKLVGDLKAIYRDLNLEQLIITGEWLDVFTSDIEVIDGDYVAKFDTSMISPQGLVFSEIFLGQVVESDGSNLGEYMFTSSYSQAQQRELMLALMGEENYATISVTIPYFVEMFNLLFEPLLEKIMIGEGQPFTIGEVTNVQLYTYKAYLCSLLLSSDSADFFLQMASSLILMYQFQYDLMVAEPYNYNMAEIVIKEHLDPTVYGDIFSGKMRYSYDLSDYGIDLVDYLDANDDGVVTGEDIAIIYGDNNDDGDYDAQDVTQQETPIDLLNAINEVLESSYNSFADIVITENVNNSIYYGFRVNLEDYGFRKIADNKYEPVNTNVNTWKQLPQYNALKAAIYDEVVAEFESAGSSLARNCLLIDVYNDAKEDLLKSQITENSSSFPKYLVIFKQYLKGEIERDEIILSYLTSIDGVAGRFNEYQSYERKLTKAKLELVDLFQIDFDQLIEMFSGDWGKINAQIKYTLGNSPELVDRYYADGSTEKLMSKSTFREFSGFGADYSEKRNVYTIASTVSEWKIQSLVDEQIELIISYAYEKGLVADKMVFDKDTLTTKFYGSTDVSFDENVENTDAIISVSGLAFMQEVADAFENAITLQNVVDQYYKYFVSYAVRMYSTQDISKAFNVVINNHAYSMSITMPTAKITEYLIGGVYLNHIGFETVFVDDQYKGFFNIDYQADGTITLPAGGEARFDTITTFFDELAGLTLRAYYMSNLHNITKSNLTDTKLSEIFYTINGDDLMVDLSNPTAEVSSNTIVKLILKTIVKNKFLTQEQLLANMLPEGFSYPNGFWEDAERAIDGFSSEQAFTAFNDVMGFLTGDYKHYHNYSAKELRLALMDAIVDYLPNSSSTELENKHRYLALFYMFCGDYIFVKTGRVNAYGEETKVNYSIDTSTKSMVLELAGLEDMPAELLVGLEYEDLYAHYEGFDENNGDVFVICTLDQETQRYIPFMMSSKDSPDGYVIATDTDGVTSINWLDKYGYGVATTDYYVSSTDPNTPATYPIIAKGIITEDGYPTAIRQINGETQFYRSNIVIRNASELNLTAYYMTMEQISTDYNFFSIITNSFSKAVSGKTLIEHAYGTIPRFKIDSSMNLPMGVDNYSIALTDSAVAMDYTFMHAAGLPMSSFYRMVNINFPVLLIAIIALIPMLIKAVYGVFGRVVDITLYYCMSPIAMSTVALGKNTGDDGKEEFVIYKKWYEDLSKKTMSVFGYVIGFQIFFIIVPFFLKVQFFADNSAFAAVPFLSGISVKLINLVVNVVMLVCSAYLITEAPKVFADILGHNDGFSEGEELKKRISDTMNEVKDTLNGQRAINAVNYAKEQFIQLSGLSLARDVVDKVKDKVGAVKKFAAKIAAKGAEYVMRYYGVPKDVAKKLSKEMSDTVTAQVDNEKKLRDSRRMLREERRLRAEDAYMQQIGEGADPGYAERLQKIEEEMQKRGLRSYNDDADKKKAIIDGYKGEVKKRKK